MSNDSLIQQIKSLPITYAGWFLYHCVPFRRRIVLNNIDTVYRDQLSPELKVHLAKAFYSHIARSLKEGLLMRFRSEQALKDSVEVRGHEQLLAVAERGQGVLVLTGHFGNWEVAPIGGILNFKAFQGQFHFIRRTLVNKTIERFLFKRYYQAGLQVIPQKNSLPKVCDVLAQNHAVVFVLDQHASIVNRDGIAVEFFGKKAGTYRSLASIARHTGAAVVPASTYRKPDGKHVLEFHAPILWQEYETTQQALYHNTLAYNQALENIILKHPEQWSWFHRRWKLKEN